jgi:hypothetical protein
MLLLQEATDLLVDGHGVANERVELGQLSGGLLLVIQQQPEVQHIALGHLVQTGISCSDHRRAVTAGAQEARWSDVGVSCLCMISQVRGGVALEVV